MLADYKQTEAGEIPNAWCARPLGELAAFRTGPFGSTLHKSDYATDCVPVVNPMHIVDGQIRPTSTMTVTESAATSLADFRLGVGDVVIGRRGDMGRCAVVREEHAGWLCGTGSMVIRPKASFDAEFCQRVLSSSRVILAIQNASVGSTMINLNQATLSELIVQVPPLAEQREITKALTDVDALLAKLNALIAKQRDLKLAAMQHLLTGKCRLPGFTEGWERLTVGQIADVKTGPFGSTLHESDYVDDGIPIITVEHLGEFRVTRQNLPLVSAADHDRLRAYRLSRGDIVFSRVGSVDRNCLIREEEEGWLFSGRLLRVRPVPTRVHPPFLSFLFHSEGFRNAVLTVAVGQTMASLNTTILRGLQVLLPPFEEQASIAAILSDFDAEIIQLEARRDKIRALKQGMMHELLTGRIRLI